MGILDRLFFRNKNKPNLEDSYEDKENNLEGKANNPLITEINVEEKEYLIDLLAKDDVCYSECQRDKLFDEAAKLVVQYQQGSTSLIQRRMNLGFNRACRIMDQLESVGIVGPDKGSKAREVYITSFESLEKLLAIIELEGRKLSKFFVDNKAEIERRRNENDPCKKNEIDRLEKEEIKQQILERERRKRLEREALEELINEEKVQKNFMNNEGKREIIPQDVMDAVWNRDSGRCIKCGSQENLEFDHIIPFSKGGATSYRNVQLLCKKCNNEKSNKIG